RENQPCSSQPTGTGRITAGASAARMFLARRLHALVRRGRRNVRLPHLTCEAKTSNRRRGTSSHDDIRSGAVHDRQGSFARYAARLTESPRRIVPPRTTAASTPTWTWLCCAAVRRLSGSLGSAPSGSVV